MRSVLFHGRIAVAYLTQFIKTRMEYKTDFIVGMAAGIFSHVIAIIFIDVLFAEKGITLNGWTRGQVMFIYGFSILPHNLFTTFFTNLYRVGDTYIIDGHMDRILTRPLNSLFQILMERIAIERVFGFLLSAGIMAYAARQMGMEWTAGKIFLVGFFAVCGTLIYGGVFTLLSALSFWMPGRIGLMPPVYNLMAFGKYPVTIYDPLLQMLLKWVIPFAFVSFFPCTYFMNKTEFSVYVMLTPVMAGAAILAGGLVWRRGVQRYESTGS